MNGRATMMRQSLPMPSLQFSQESTSAPSKALPVLKAAHFLAAVTQSSSLVVLSSPSAMVVWGVVPV